MSEHTGQVTRWVGLTLFFAGVLALIGYGLYGLLADAEAPAIVKFGVLALYGGMAVLGLLALRQRLIVRRTDRYRDIEI